MQNTVTFKKAWLNLVFFGGILVAGFSLGYFFWNKIQLPFSNPRGVISFLTLQKFNPNTNVLRYLMFISLPSGILLLLYLNRGVRRLFFAEIPDTESAHAFSNPRLERVLRHRTVARICLGVSFVVIAGFCLSAVIAFLSRDWAPSALDIYHEGERLTPAYNYLKTGWLWKGSVFVHGALQDPLITYFGWKFFGYTTIGASRVAVQFMWFLIPFIVALFLVLLPSALTGTKAWWQKIVLTQLLLAFFLCTNADGGAVALQRLVPRDLFVVLGFAFLILAFGLRKPVLFFITGLFSALTYAYSIDRGTYFSALLAILAICFLAFPPDRNPALRARIICFFAGGIVIGWVMFFLIFGPDEFNRFLEIYSPYLQEGCVGVTICPKPGFSKHTIVMGMIGIQLYGFVIYFLKQYRRDPRSRPLCYTHISFVVLSALYFVGSFTRWDAGHLYYVSTFAVLGLGFLAWLILKGLDNAYVAVIMMIALFGLNTGIISKNFPQTDVTRIAGFKTRVSLFVRCDDAAFLNPYQQAAVARMKEIFKNEKYFFSFTSEAGMPYLLKKPSCGRNFIAWICSARPAQYELISDLRYFSPEYILVRSNYWTNTVDGMDTARRVGDVDRFIRSRYAPCEVIEDNWQIYRKKAV
ncbi:MAG: hypothetical protein PHS37_01350 [Candidatus Omnitrophica bacterium]|nr:hypothetical protein [Candidatus Omnitrophota bacterium]